MSTVLVTGAAGFVGLNIVETLLEQGRDVVALDRRPPPARARRDLQGRTGAVAWIVGDVTDTTAMGDLLHEHAVDVVIHAAAITAGPELERDASERVVAINVGGTASVVAAAKRAGVGRVIAIGTAAVHGDVAHRADRLEEDTPCQPRSLYALTKKAAEDVALRMGETLGIEVVVPRLGWLFGRWEHETGVRETVSTLFHIVAAARRGDRVVLPCDAVIDWAPGTFAARRITTLAAARAPRHRVYALGPDRAFSLTDWCRALERRLPQFHWTIDEGGGTVPVAAPPRGALLSGARFVSEFGGEPAPGLDQSLDEYLDWLAAASEEDPP